MSAQESLGDYLALKLRWLETHDWHYEPNPAHPDYDTAICDHCLWPPALDGRCLCDLEDR